MPENECTAVASGLSRLTAEARDKLIRQAVTEHIGPDWETQDLIPRMKCMVVTPETQTYTLDDHPIITLTPADIQQAGDRLNATFRYGFHPCPCQRHST